MGKLGLVILGISGALVGCDNIESSQVDTSDIGLIVRAEASETGRLDVLAQLTTDNPALLEVTYINLSEGDELLASLDGDTQRLREEFIVGLGIYQYATEFENVVGSESLNIDLSREQFDDAPMSFVQIPGPFSIDAMPDTFSVSAGLTVRWSGGTDVDESEVSISSSCLESSSVSASGNSGELRLRPTDFAYRTGADPTEPCPLEIQVFLVNDGEADPAYGRGGRIRAFQSRTVELTAEP